MKRVLIIGVTFCVFLGIGHAKVIYVHPDSVYNTIQEGLNACSPGDVVLVAYGTYHEHITWPNTQGIQLISETGYYYTTINGDNAGTVITVASGVDSTTKISGFTITGGYAPVGGGIICLNSSPTISNNNIDHNRATGYGGGIYCSNASPKIVDNQITRCSADSGGGGVFCASNSAPLIKDSFIWLNELLGNLSNPFVPYGAGVGCKQSSPTILDNTISSNQATMGRGGGIGIATNSMPVIDNNIIINNDATYPEWGGGGIGSDSTCTPVISNNTITQNEATYAGGGIGCYAATITNNEIYGNRADYGGGIVCGSHSSPTVSNNTITGNLADYAGGGITNYHNTAIITYNTISGNQGSWGGGGIACVKNCSTLVRHNTITNNITNGSIGKAGGILVDTISAPIIDSCIISGNDRDGILCSDSSRPIIHYNDITDNDNYGVRNDDSRVTVNAENNWWGHPSGPSGAGPGLGEGVSSYVDFNPWLTSSVLQFDSVPPASPYITRVDKVSNNAKLIWHKVTTDTAGNTENMNYYIVYRSTVPSFVPGAADSIGATDHPDTTFTDINALTANLNYYYLVKSVDAAYNTSKNSNMGYVFNKFVNENHAGQIRTDRNWVSLPWHGNYSTASDLTNDLCPAGIPLDKVVNLRDDNYYESWLWDPDFGEWYGTNFAITSGRCYEMNTMQDDTLVLVGSNNPNGLVFLNENPTTTDRNWVSIPYNNVYAVVSDVTTEYSPGGNPLVKCTNLRDDQKYESWLWDPDFGEWYGANFDIERGRGYEFVTIIDTTWNPTEYSNEASFSIVQNTRKSTAEVRVGTELDAHRSPTWHERTGMGPKTTSTLSVEKMKSTASHVSLIVRLRTAAGKNDVILFTAYRPDDPDDALTEHMVGSGVAYHGETAVLWFDVGNFEHPWLAGEEVIVVVEALKDNRSYYAAIDFTLDGTKDIQDLGEIQLVPIPERTSNVIGYSMYRGEQRLNQEIRSTYEQSEDATIRPVIRGGYETVYGSRVYVEQEPNPVHYGFAVQPSLIVEKGVIEYGVADRGRVEIVVYDAAGRVVKTLIHGIHNPGWYSATWDGTDERGDILPSGVYFIKFTAAAFTAQEKVLLAR